jgi:hypothetical protein
MYAKQYKKKLERLSDLKKDIEEDIANADKKYEEFIKFETE